MSLLELKHISKSFKEHIVLEDINLRINEGECIYIHGKNGCGKSTLFKIICDIMKADDGIINVSDHTYVGALIENPGFIETETIKFNLKFLASLKNHYDESKIIGLCSDYNLDYSNRSSMKSYSVGMRQKAGIIQAVMENQNLILFDEPTRGLDEESIETFEKMIRDLLDENKSVIIASHDLLPHIAYSKKYMLEKGILIEE
ncbi:MAG: ATP-binding cassette domain-containing protein [Erysipelotrichaceae bacterium]|nr:ATP-binding cassette domain-containing protein [Erysipelotrichaceae bacterium]